MSSHRKAESLLSKLHQSTWGVVEQEGFGSHLGGFGAQTGGLGVQTGAGVHTGFGVQTGFGAHQLNKLNKLKQVPPATLLIS